MGDLKSVVLHDMRVTHVKSSFPMALGALWPPRCRAPRRMLTRALAVARRQDLRRRRQDVLVDRRGLLDHHPPQLGVDGGEQPAGRRRLPRLRVRQEVPRGAAAPALPCHLAGAHAPPRSQYTAENLSEKGIHEVSQRRFVLVSADHPIVSAISENADKLQMGEIAVRCARHALPRSRVR